jgi:multidrug efflux pump subunit AcrA (membrane-fusion protein)
VAVVSGTVSLIIQLSIPAGCETEDTESRGKVEFGWPTLSGDRVEISDGVAPGDTVAVDGHFALAHDAPVRVGEVRKLHLE